MLEFSGQRLSMFRRAAGLRVEDLAERSGLSLSTIKNLESGRNTNPSARTLQRLACGLDRPAMSFFGEHVQQAESEAV